MRLAGCDCVSLRVLVAELHKNDASIGNWNCSVRAAPPPLNLSKELFFSMKYRPWKVLPLQNDNNHQCFFFVITVVVAVGEMEEMHSLCSLFI